MRSLPTTLLAAAALFCGFTGTVLAADNSALMQRLMRLERDVNQLNSQAYRGGAGGGAPMGSDFAAGFEVRLSQIEQQIQALTGRVEQLQYQLQLQQQQSEKVLGDLQLRVQDLESGGGAAPAASPASQPSLGAGATPNAPAGGDDSFRGGEQASGGGQLTSGGSPEAAYDQAYARIRQNDFAGAEQAFGQFVATWPQHPLAGNAQFWLGQSRYLQKNYPQAAATFADAYQKFPKSQKAPESLKQLGFSLSAMGRSQDACVTFSQLNSQFPQLPAALKQEVSHETSRLKCN